MSEKFFNPEHSGLSDEKEKPKSKKGRKIAKEDMEVVPFVEFENVNHQPHSEEEIQSWDEKTKGQLSEFAELDEPNRQMVIDVVDQMRKENRSTEEILDSLRQIISFAKIKELFPKEKVQEIGLGDKDQETKDWVN